MRNPTVLLLAFVCLLSRAQDYTTPGQFTFTVDSNLVYGVDTNYMGQLDTLLLDLYKPIGNPDTKRPLVVFVHGGSWLGGCKDDPSGIVPMLHQFAGRGYVVASINYRLGWHKANYVLDPVAGFQPSFWPEPYRSFYAADSAEIKRANYRGMQDVKGAIRFLKGRAELDSVCVDKVFLGGESAGGFISLAAAFVDQASKKPAVCGALPPAPPPYSKTLNMTALNCGAQVYTADSLALLRPDLGPVEGDLNLNGHDASVKGVANFFGGVPHEAFALDWFQGNNLPSVYQYHQTCDGIVLFGRGKPSTTLSAFCNVGSTPWHYGYPDMYGSGSIENAFDSMVAPPAHTTDFITCQAFDPNFALFECARYGNNGSYHYTIDHALRAQNLSAWWAPQATEPSACLNTGLSEPPRPVVHLFPQPADNWLRIDASWNGVVHVTDAAGRVVRSAQLSNGMLDTSALPNGIYQLRAMDTNTPAVRFCVMHP